MQKCKKSQFYNGHNDFSLLCVCVLEEWGENVKVTIWKEERKGKEARCWWFTPVNLATWEAEIRRIMARSQPRQTVHLIPISKLTRGK
jgi:hypothetical protein